MENQWELQSKQSSELTNLNFNSLFRIFNIYKNVV